MNPMYTVDQTAYRDDVYVEEMPISFDAAAINPFRILKWVLFVFGVITPILIVIKTPPDDYAVALLAYLNTVAGGWVCYHLLKKQTVGMIVPLLFLGMLIISFPVAVLYFSIFNPHAYYTTMYGVRSYLDAGFKVQLATLLFTAPYCAVVLYYLRNDRQEIKIETFSYFAVAFSVFLSAGLIFAQSLNVLGKIPSILSWLLFGFYNYLHGIVLLAGAMFRQMSVLLKLFLFVLLTAAMLFFTIGNARGTAVQGIFLLVIGFLFFGEYTRKFKLRLIVFLIIAFPVFLTISNATRMLLGTAGFEEGVGYRFEQLLRWREVADETAPLDTMLGRLFFTGGHVIIADTPSRVPYRAFSLYRFPKEMVESLLPQRLYYAPHYRHHGILIDYHLRVTEETSISLSMPGSLWILGGYPFMVVGGIAVGLLHIWIISLIQTNWARSQIAGLIYLGVILPAIYWGSREAFISHWRGLFYHVILAYLLSRFVLLFVGSSQSDAEDESAMFIQQ